MKKLRLGKGFVVFIIFFGVAVIDAIVTGSLPRIIFWLVTGTLFIVADNLKKAH